jgi:hypothetical protein
MPLRKLPPSEQLIAMYRSGMSAPEIAQATGCAAVSVGQALRRAGERLRSAKEAAALAVARGRATPTRYWLGKQRPREVVERAAEKVRGERHYAWKGGVERRPYRGVVEKDQCEVCGTQDDLCIHHRDFDHYHNEKANLQILCRSHHLSLHKQAYWDARRAGKPTPKSTGPSHWRKSGQ